MQPFGDSRTQVGAILSSDGARERTCILCHCKGPRGLEEKSVEGTVLEERGRWKPCTARARTWGSDLMACRPLEA